MSGEHYNRSSSVTQGWFEVTKGDPCPLCRKSDWCFISPDKQAVVCGRVDAHDLPTDWERIRTAKDGRNIYSCSTGDTKQPQTINQSTTTFHTPSQPEQAEQDRDPIKPSLIRTNVRQHKLTHIACRKSGNETTYIYQLKEPIESVTEVGMTRIDPPDGKKKCWPYALTNNHGIRYEHKGQWKPYLWEVLLSSVVRHQTPDPDYTRFILIVEGEKCAVEANLHGVATITFDYKAWNQEAITWAIEWIRDQHLSIVMWPDNDKVGLDKAKKVKEVCQALNVEYYQLDPNKLTSNPSEGWDIADYLQEHDMTGDQLVQLIESQIKELYLLGQPYPNGSSCKTEEKGSKEEGIPVTKLLIQIGSQYDLWHTEDKDLYADVRIDGIRHTYPLKSEAFKDLLLRELYTKYNKAANQENLGAAMNILRAKALFDSGQYKIWLRTGLDDLGNVYIDLANQYNQVIKVTREDWEIIPSSQCPIRFHRSGSQLPMPLPEKGGSLDDLWKLIKVDSEYQPLLITWLLSCLFPSGAKPIVYLVGSKGAGKTTTGKILKDIIDPTKAPLLPKVGSDKDIVATARNRWLLVYDNLSKLTPSEQDNLCRTATGAGFSQRKLYTDMDESYFDYTRPQILTSVDFVPNRSDLLDRCIIVKCNRLPDSDRSTDQKIDQLVKQYLPGILGCLLDLLVKALSTKDSIDCPLPRMADYALLGIAAGIPNFIETYNSNITETNNLAIEANPIAKAIKDYLDNYFATYPSYQSCTSTTIQLVEALKGISDEPQVQRLNSDSLGKLLTQSLRTDLEAVGIYVSHTRKASGRGWSFTRG
ncbi:MAG: hypothetical protein OHK0012_07370 [Synechococcales cyanobacterium]